MAEEQPLLAEAQLKEGLVVVAIKLADQVVAEVQGAQEHAVERLEVQEDELIHWEGLEEKDHGQE